MAKTLLFTMLALCAVLHAEGVYVEEFDAPGRPKAPPGMEWARKTQLSFPVSWEEMVPGDGFARIGAERRILGRCSRKQAFQTLSIGPVDPGTRLSMRAKNMAVSGLVGLFFTYTGREIFDEIDIEIVAVDTTVRPAGAVGNWTDARFNTWSGADQQTLAPGMVQKLPLRDSGGARVSHRDGGFHVYTIEWKIDSVRFLVDGVEQAMSTVSVPSRAARLNLGFRHVPWAGNPDWKGTQTMLVDWVKIEPLEP